MLYLLLFFYICDMVLFNTQLICNRSHCNDTKSLLNLRTQGNTLSDAALASLNEINRPRWCGCAGQYWRCLPALPASFTQCRRHFRLSPCRWIWNLSLARSLFLVFRLKNGTSIKPKFESYPQHKSCKSIEFKFVFLADKNYHHFRGFTYKMRSSFPAH